MEDFPEIKERELWDDDEPDGYLESDIDWMKNNWEACIWFLENHAKIRDLMQKSR